MTTINTIEDLARILRDQPTWAEALRALLLTQELLDLPGRFDRFVEAQREFNQAQQEANQAQQGDQPADRPAAQHHRRAAGRSRRTTREPTRRAVRTDRSHQGPGPIEVHPGLHRLLRCPEPGRPDRSPAEQRHRPGHPERTCQPGTAAADLFEANLIISAEDNRHAVVEVSLTADQDDIDRAKTRAGILAAITEGAVTPVVITSRLNPAQSAQAEAAGVTTFVIPYP